jgi:hypothetical protein
MAEATFTVPILQSLKDTGPSFAASMNAAPYLSHDESEVLATTCNYTGNSTQCFLCLDFVLAYNCWLRLHPVCTQAEAASQTDIASLGAGNARLAGQSILNCNLHRR